MEREFSSKLTGRFVDDDDIVRTGRAWVEIDGFDFLHVPVPAGFEGTMAKFESQAAQVAQDASSADKSADRAANIAKSTSWSGDRLTVNGKTSPSLTGPQGPPGEVTMADFRPVRDAVEKRPNGWIIRSASDLTATEKKARPGDLIHVVETGETWEVY